MRATKLTLGLALALGLAGCKSNPPAGLAPIVDANNGVDPASVNMAPVDPNAPPLAATPSYTASVPTRTTNGRVLGQRAEYPATQPTTEQYANTDEAYDQYDQQVNAGQDALYADQAPPPLPVYDQPELTQANDQWTPGYWNYGNNGNTGYYFVPGAWVAPPYAGALWTPGYWGYEGRRYRFHHGFWGRHIGFYGGINYGFGYTGRGYDGGYWNNNNFYYNQRFNRVNVATVRNVYVRNVVVENDRRYSYNGPGGYSARPVPAELAVYREQRLPPQRAQFQLREQAATNRQQFFAENHGRPAVFVAPQRFNADAQQARPIQPVQRGGFGQPAFNNQAQQQQRVQADQQRNNVIQQQNAQRQQQQNAQQQVRTQQAQQQQQQRQQVQQQRTAQQQQRNVQQEQQQQRNTQQQQRTAQQQQQNGQRQQQELQRQQQLQQRNTQQQQNAQQLQQRATQQQTAQQQERIQAQQQRNTAAQQQNAQRQQQVQVQQQRTQQNAQAQQQRAQQEQQRGQQMQQRQQQEQQRTQQVEQRQQERPQQVQPQRAQPQAAQPQPQAPRPQPAAQAPRPQPQQQAPRAEPHGGERPHR